MASETAIQKTEPQNIEINNPHVRRSAWTYRPNVDVFETADELLMIADMPGASPDAIDVSVESGILTIESRVAGRDHGQAQMVTREYGVGNFHRRFEIDDSIDPEGVRAEYRDGALTVHLPKAQQARRRRIPVTG